MAVSEIVKHDIDGSLTFQDGTGTPLTLVVLFSHGDLKIGPLMQGQVDIRKFTARGRRTCVRAGARVDPQISFTAQLTDVADGTDRTIIDWVLKTGASSGNLSTSPTGWAFTTNLLWTIEGTDLGDAADHTVLAKRCRVQLEIAEGEPTILSISGEVLGDVDRT
jgi:hypothetical protein